jgi:hypothetical protein
MGALSATGWTGRRRPARSAESWIVAEEAAEMIQARAT